MRTYEKQVVKVSAITFVMVLFLLVALPAALVFACGIFGGNGEDGINLFENGINFFDGGKLSDGGSGSLDGIVVSPGPAEPGSVDSDNIKVAVYRTDTKKVEEIPLEQYVLGVTASEMPATFHLEALKAQAVAARTYGLAKVEKSKTGNPEAHPKAPLCDDVHCQVFRSEDELRKVKGDTWMKESFPIVSQAVSSTKGQVMYYQGQLVQQPLFHSASGGRTENSEDVFTASVPYLRSVESGEYESGAYEAEKVNMKLSAFIKKAATLNKAAAAASADSIRVLSRSQGGGVEQLQVGGATLTGRRVRELLGLRSANFTVAIAGDEITFTTSGNGHGVGMSQYGADGMGKAGYNYKEILQHYYSGVEVR